MIITIPETPPETELAATHTCKKDNIDNKSASTICQIDFPAEPYPACVSVVSCGRHVGVYFLRSLLHFGPILALCMILFVLSLAYMCNARMWPEDHWLEALHRYIVLSCACIIIYCFIRAVIADPGFLPLHWMPANEADKEVLPYCDRCEGYQAPRAHHCVICGRCVMKMDHHCPWINNCVGHGNHGFFIYFLLSVVVGCVYTSLILSFFMESVNSPLSQANILVYVIPEAWRMVFGQPTLLRSPIYDLYDLDFPCQLALLLATSMGVAIVVLFLGQMIEILQNRSGIEGRVISAATARLKQQYETEKIYLLARKSQGDDVGERLAALRCVEFRSPYDLGWRQNAVMVLTPSCRPHGDGINWPVRPGCDPLMLMREHLAQKKVRLDKMKVHLIVEDYSGSCVPISKGLKTSIFTPLQSWSRLRLRKGDRVLAGYGRKHWLYGQLVSDGPSADFGWFPSRCAVEQIQKKDV